MLYACERLGVAPAQAVAIGDSINDAQAGRAAGVHVLAVPYGYNEGQDVHGLDVDGIVGSIAEAALRSEEHTSELQSLMRISYAVFCLKKKKKQNKNSK